MGSHPALRRDRAGRPCLAVRGGGGEQQGAARVAWVPSVRNQQKPPSCPTPGGTGEAQPAARLAAHLGGRHAASPGSRVPAPRAPSLQSQVPRVRLPAAAAAAAGGGEVAAEQSPPFPGTRC